MLNQPLLDKRQLTVPRMTIHQSNRSRHYTTDALELLNAIIRRTEAIEAGVLYELGHAFTGMLEGRYLSRPNDDHCDMGRWEFVR